MARQCERCGAGVTAYAPEALCPRCLLRDGLVLPANAADPVPELAAGPPHRTIRYFGDYELLEEIARGGMGVVFQARQISLNRIVAVKLLLAGKFSSPEFVQRSRAEAEAAANLQHPNIVAIHEIGEHEGQQYFSMDYVEGRSLAERARNNPLPPEMAASYLRTIALAIHYAHQRGILHRDLKPSNVLIDAADRPRVTDFGLAKRLADSQLETRNTELTVTGQVLGTPQYLSPEQASGRRGAVTVASDVYGLGAILYFLLTGRAPFVADSMEGVLEQVLHAEPTLPRLLEPSVPRDLETICLKCLSKEPRRRYESAQALADDLQRWLNHEPIHARPASPPEKLWRWCGRKPVVAALVFALLLVGAAGLAGILWQWQRAGVQAARAVQQERIAVRAQRQAEREAELARLNAYAADMAGVHRALERGDYGLARQILAAHRPKPGQPDLRGFEWRYFWQVSRGEQWRTLQGHSDTVECVAFSPDGRLLASASRDRTVRLWDPQSCRLLASLAAHTNAVLSVAFSADGRWLASGGEDQGVRLWSVPDGRLIRTLSGRQARLAFSPTGAVLAVASWGDAYGRNSGDVVLWDCDQGVKVRALPDAGGRVAFSPDGRWLATGPSHNIVRLWDVASGTEVQSFADPRSVLWLGFTRDGAKLIACHNSGTVFLWDIASGEAKSLHEGPPGMARAAALSPDGRHLSTASVDHAIRLWNPETLESTALRRGHLGEVQSVAFSPDSQLLASGSKDRTVRLWRLEGEAADQFIPGLTGTPRFAARAPLMAFRLEGGDRVAVWDLAKHQSVAEIPGQVPLALSPEGRTLLVSTPRPLALRLVEIETQKVLKTVPLSIGPEGYAGMQASADGSMVYVRELSGEVSLWNTATGEKLLGIRGPWQATWAAKFSPDDRTFAISAGNNTVVVWDLKKRQQIATLAGHHEYVTRLTFSADGQLLATAGADADIKIWGGPPWHELATFSGHQTAIGDVSFTPDTKTLASTSDGHLQFWHLASHRALVAHYDEQVGQYAVFSPDGNALIIKMQARGALQPRGARVWRAPSLAECDTELGAWEKSFTARPSEPTR